ncbi:hypothetical protein UP00_06890 [Enterobacter asburiae]|nr:hypothetical protein NI40_010205 [Enterobacter sp. E20]KJI64835.1 hypothetical protein UP00_06890 [Enterobacter asburiae]KJW80807.1 hypothetical protein SG67_16715 [Enterobacter asburiae]KJX09459.1 hypothetical protein SG66_17025 [Enterobacter asburiae]
MRQLLLTCREHNQSSSFTWPAETFVLRGGDISKRVICREIKQSQMCIVMPYNFIIPFGILFAKSLQAG